MKNIPTYMPVVAAALRGQGGRWLMHRRSLEKVHGGLWEFPGGKVESDETPAQALVRELHEELGITVRPDSIAPAGFAESAASDGQLPIVIMLYTVDDFGGEPKALEGEAIGWFVHGEIARLQRPPLDIALADTLRRLFPQ